MERGLKSEQGGCLMELKSKKNAAWNLCECGCRRPLVVGRSLNKDGKWFLKDHENNKKEDGIERMDVRGMGKGF